MVSVLHIGLPLGPPWLTADEVIEIEARLKGIRHKMENAGYRYVVMHASPDGDLEELRRWLRREPCHVVVIGGGVAADPRLFAFKQQIMGAVAEEAPRAKLLDFDHSGDLQVLIARTLRTS